MTRARTNVPSRKWRKKILKQARGYRGARSKLNRTAQEAVMRAMAYSYRGRKEKKRNFRSLWITRVRAGVQAQGWSYSGFMNALNKANVKIDRKILAELVVNQPDVFRRIVDQVKNS